jgi:hypothetical protein
LIIGNFELDLDDGEVRYKVAVDLEGVSDIAPLVETHLAACVTTFDQYRPALDAVREGTTTVSEALQGVETPP